jgi:hypothetical protein
MILAVDEALAPYNDIRHEARSAMWAPPSNTAHGPDDIKHRWRIKEYMAIWERVETLIVDESLDSATVGDLYGDRVKFLLRNEIIQTYIIDKSDDWKKFCSLARRLARTDAELKIYVRRVDEKITLRNP